MLSDIEIADAAELLPITQVAKDELGIDAEALVPYGHTKAKVSLEYTRSLADRPDGKLILVTAISPTPAGEGKTTTSVGVADALRRLGRRRWWRCASRRSGRYSASRVARPEAATPKSSR